MEFCYHYCVSMGAKHVWRYYSTLSFFTACYYVFLYFVFIHTSQIILLIKGIMITLISYEDVYLTAFLTLLFMESTSFAFIWIPRYVFLCRFACKVQILWESHKIWKKNTHFFPNFCVLLRISELVSNGQCFFCQSTALVEFLWKYINRYANRCIVNWSSKKIKLFILKLTIFMYIFLQIGFFINYNHVLLFYLNWFQILRSYPLFVFQRSQWAFFKAMKKGSLGGQPNKPLKNLRMHD